MWYIIKVNLLNINADQYKNLYKKQVVQYDMNGNYIGEYDSIKEACITNNFPFNSYIGECCMGKRRMYKNYIWKYKD